MTGDEWPGAEDLRKQLTAQLSLQARCPGWQVLHTTCERWVRYVRIPEGWFYAVHVRLGEPPLVAADLDRLAGLVEQRQREMLEAALWVMRSELRGVLPYIPWWR